MCNSHDGSCVIIVVGEAIFIMKNWKCTDLNGDVTNSRKPMSND